MLYSLLVEAGVCHKSKNVNQLFITTVNSLIATTSRKLPALQRLYSTEPKRLKTTSQVVTLQNRKLLYYFNSHNG